MFYYKIVYKTIFSLFALTSKNIRKKKLKKGTKIISIVVNVTIIEENTIQISKIIGFCLFDFFFPNDIKNQVSVIRKKKQYGVYRLELKVDDDEHQQKKKERLRRTKTLNASKEDYKIDKDFIRTGKNFKDGDTLRSTCNISVDDGVICLCFSFLFLLSLFYLFCESNNGKNGNGASNNDLLCEPQSFR